jgi:arylsulfatase A-like enzyme
MLPRMRRLLTGSILAAALPLGACGGGAADERVSVLLISLDSTRHDLLSCYGYESPYAPGVPSSPHLDRLAAEGVVFEQAYATTSWTLPSHMTMLSGQPELVHAVDHDYHRPHAAMPWVPSVFADAGYHTAGFFSGPYLDPHFGFERGFERYEACYGPALTAASEEAAAARANLVAAEAAGDPVAIAAARREAGRLAGKVDTLSHRDRSTATVVDAALSAIERAHDEERPFFVFAHFFDPHYDYVPPVEFDRFDPDYQGTLDGHDFMRNPALSEPDLSGPGLRKRVVDDRGLDHMRALYAGEMAWTDSEVGRLLARLDELGLRERTLVVVTADHGDEFFEHGGLGHRRTLFEEVTRVPLILRLPGTLPAGKRVDALASTLDLAPTMLDLVGLDTPPEVVSTSLRDVIDGRDGAERTATGRIVRVYGLEVGLQSAAGPVRVPARLVRIAESFRRGPIKVTRTREWTEAQPGATPEQARALAARAGREVAEDRLLWIDVVAHPDERPEDHSTDFDDPRAKAALQAFRAQYEQLLAQRRAGALAADNEAFSGALDALGYGGDDAHRSMTSEEFELPPPGDGVL